MHNMQYLFVTRRLGARKFASEDAERLYESHKKEDVRRWIPNESYADVREARDAVGFYMDCAGKGVLPYVLAVELMETGELIGDVGVNEVEGEPNEVEIGYRIGPEYSGRGYATELVTAMTRFVIERFGIKRLYGRVMKGNLASVRVLEKNGYVFVKEEQDAEDDPYGNGMLVYRKEIPEML